MGKNFLTAIFLTLAGVIVAHCDDLSPYQAGKMYSGDALYRNFNYVVQECQRLANQLLTWM